MHEYETDSWPFVQARWYKDIVEQRRVRVVVIHDMEAPEKGDTAENVARYFQDPKDDQGRPVQASAHVCVDNNSVVQCVHDNDVAYAAPGCNGDGIQIEMAGYGKQTRDEWLDDYGQQLLGRAADVAAQYCLKYNLAPVHLTDNQLEAGQRGIVGHVQVSRVYKRSNHQDPGINFPWDVFMPMVVRAYNRRKLK